MILMFFLFRTSPERALQRRRLTGQQLGATLANDHYVFEPYSKFAGYVNSRLIAERHTRFELRLVSANEVCPFVTVHSYPVSNSVSEVLVIRAEARIHNHLARSRVDVLASHAGTRRLQRCRLGALHDVEHAQLFLGWLAKNRGPGDVGGITLDRATAVDQ